MPDPLVGLSVVAECGTKFEADAVVARLQSAGIDATPSYDPAINTVAPYFASDRTFEVLVRDEDVDEATALLIDNDDLPEEFTLPWEPLGSTSTTRRRIRGCLIGSIIVAFVAIAGSAVLIVTSGNGPRTAAPAPQSDPLRSTPAPRCLSSAPTGPAASAVAGTELTPEQDRSIHRPGVVLALVVNSNPNCFDPGSIMGAQDYASFQLQSRTGMSASVDYANSRVIVECLNQVSPPDREALINWLVSRPGVIDVRAADGTVLVSR